MRKLHAGLRWAAREKGCQVEGPTDLSEREAAAGFTLKYSKQNNAGEVVVTRSERTEKEYQDKDGKPVKGATLKLEGNMNHATIAAPADNPPQR